MHLFRLHFIILLQRFILLLQGFIFLLHRFLVLHRLIPLIPNTLNGSSTHLKELLIYLLLFQIFFLLLLELPDFLFLELELLVLNLYGFTQLGNLFVVLISLLL